MLGTLRPNRDLGGHYERQKEECGYESFHGFYVSILGFLHWRGNNNKCFGTWVHFALSDQTTSFTRTAGASAASGINSR